MPCLKETVALITGCGPGMGRALVQRFIEEGARVGGNRLLGMNWKPNDMVFACIAPAVLAATEIFALGRVTPLLVSRMSRGRR